jgi:hypothetical protein
VAQKAAKTTQELGFVQKTKANLNNSPINFNYDVAESYSTS